MTPKDIKRNETIERQLVNKINSILHQYQQPEIEWQSNRNVLQQVAENVARLQSTGSTIPLNDRAKWELEEIEDTLSSLKAGTFVEEAVRSEES